MQPKLIRRQAAGLAVVLALGLWPGGANASVGFEPQMARPTSAGGWQDRSGFGELVYRSILEGWLVGMEVGAALVDFQNDPATASRVALGGVLGGAAGLAVPLLLSRGEVRSGDVVLMGAAQGLGMANGFFIPFTIQAASCTNTTSCPFFDTTVDTIRLDLALSAALSLGAGAATILIANHFNFSPGQAEAMGSASMWGALVGLLITIAIPNAYSTQPALVSGLSIAGADLGFLAAFLLRDFFDMDRSRIGFLDLGVGVGVAAGWALAYFIAPSSQNGTSTSLAMLGGAAAGWAVAYYATGALDGYKQNAPVDKPATAHFNTPTISPMVSMARGETKVGLQLDLVRGTF